MRVLEVVDFAALLSFFALLLLAFGFDFHVSRKVAKLYRNRARFFILISILGEVAASSGLVLCWLSLFLDEWSVSTDAMVVFIPGTIACVCIVLLTFENSFTRFRLLDRTPDGK